MREIRLSGSVEGVVSNHDPYSDWTCSEPEDSAVVGIPPAGLGGQP